MTKCDKGFTLAFRFLMAWTFLYAASHQTFDPSFTIVGFLKTTKTFHSLFAIFTTPAIAPVFSFLVAWGHLLIGLSLLVGLFTRLSAAFGIMLMGVYWMAHMDFPFIENRNNFLIDFHIVYAFVLAWLIAHRGGIVLGLDSWAGKLPIVRNNALLRWVTGAA